MMAMMLLVMIINDDDDDNDDDSDSDYIKPLIKIKIIINMQFQTLKLNSHLSHHSSSQ